MTAAHARLTAAQEHLASSLAALVRAGRAPGPPAGLDEGAFHRLCLDHGVAGAVARAPGALEGLAVRERLAAVHLQTFARAAEIERRRDEAVGELARRSIPAVVLKGADWAFRIHPDPGCRPMCDIDLLVPEAATADAVRAIEACGYALGGPPDALARGYTVGLRALSPPDVRIEVHPRLCRPARHPVVSDDLFRRAAPLAGGGPGLRLGDADGLAYCALHHALHGYRVPLLWLVDFALLVVRAADAFPEAVRIADGWGARAALHTSLRLATSVLGPLPVPGGPPAIDPLRRALLSALITPDHLRMNRLRGDRAARAATALPLMDRGRRRYLADRLRRMAAGA